MDIRDNPLNNEALPQIIPPDRDNSHHTDPEMVIMSRWALLDESSVVGGNIAVMAVLLQHVDLSLDLFLFFLCHVHYLDGSQLARLNMTPLNKGRVNLIILIQGLLKWCLRRYCRRPDLKINIDIYFFHCFFYE